MVKLIRSDLDFILQQIEIAEAHAAGGDLLSLVGDPLLPFGLRAVNGSNNNLVPGQETFGQADQLFPRMLPRDFTQGTNPGLIDFDGPGPAPPVPVNSDYSVNGSVYDTAPRFISNAIVDQTANNPAAVAAALELAGVAGQDAIDAMAAIQAAVGAGDDALVTSLLTAAGVSQDPISGTLFIQNTAPDEGLSAPFNSWFTLFGQFFDHGLDLVPKGGNGSVVVPLLPDDPLYVPGSPTNFMILTRATNQPGPDGVTGTADDVREAVNLTTPFVDQNQTYTSHPSHQVFLRAYELDASGKPVATGKLLDNRAPNGDGEYFGVGSVDLGGLTTWAVVKAQARELLGIELDDLDIVNLPLILTDDYGKFIPDPVTGFAQVVVGTNPNGTPILASGTPGAPIDASLGLRTGHAFLDDIAQAANPLNNQGQLRLEDGNDTIGDHFTGIGDDGRPMASNNPNQGGSLYYDNELLDAHKITGDGRGNENIGLTAVHHVFHAEHNRMADAVKEVILAEEALTPGYISNWVKPGFVFVPGMTADQVDWNGERIFQTAKFSTEMQYQHLVFEEFGRKVQPLIDVFSGYDVTINPAIVAEFAHVVYRFGHSMLTETVDSMDTSGVTTQVTLLEAFVNPVLYDTTGGTDAESAGAIVRGMTRQAGNEIDEFVTDVLRNNLLGLPLDLATLNISRARDTGVPSLNEARREFYAATNGDSVLKPYNSWTEFAQNVKNPLSVINFIAAYGTHSTITSATSLEDKRLAALELVTGVDQNGDNIVAGDRLAFLNSTGDYAPDANGRTTSGLDDVDFWIGGLAEKITPFGGMLGSTFNFVFETQMEALQNGDRFYYLGRLAGTNFLTELEGNSFAAIISKNTDINGDGMHLPADIFSTPTWILEVDQSKQVTGLGVDGRADPEAEPDPFNPFGTVTPLVVRDNPNTPGPDQGYLQYTGVDHVVLGGTNPGNVFNPSGNDTLIGSIGDDSLWGDDGNDVLEGGDGVDQLIGGGGNDIITDFSGDDNFKGGDGDDVINAGAGLDLILLGDGNDYSIGGEDLNETFGGNGNDFIFAGDDADIVFGDGGDDWIEGGGGADLLQGDLGAPFQDGPLPGNDVIWGQGGNDDYDSESGDDIMVASPGTERFEGMLGYDWVTYVRNPENINADLELRGLLPPDLDTIADRFDLTEGLSGSNGNDVLRGDSVGEADLLNVDAATGFNNALNTAEQIALIDGLSELLGGATSFAGGNIILGGLGSDIIEGRGGNDIIDGDKFLNVRISVVDGNGVEIDTVTSMLDLRERMFTGEVTPGQLRIVREILPGDANSGVDIAVFSGSVNDYVITGDGLNGTPVTVRHNLPVGANDPDTGTDTLYNIEILQFNDGTVILDPNITNNPIQGLVTIDLATDTTFGPLVPGQLNVGDVLTANISGLTDLDGLPLSAANFNFTWQVEQTAGLGDFIDLEDELGLVESGQSLVLRDALALDGLAVRVVVSVFDNNGFPEVAFSASTDPIIGLAPVAPEPAVVLGNIGTGDPEGLTFSLDDLRQGITDLDTPVNLLIISGVTLDVAVGDPAPGFLNDNGNGTFTFFPDPLFIGGVSIAFTISDGTHVTDATADIEVVDPVDGPTGVQDDFVGTEEVALSISINALLANDLPIAGGTLVAANFGNAVGGTLQIVGPNVIFTPDPDFFGLASFEYTPVEDGFPGLPTIVTIDVANVNDAPTAPASQNITVDEDGISGFILSGATDVDFDLLTAELKPGFEPAKGVVNFNGDVFEYIPNANENGTDVFTIVISDGNGGSTEQVVNVTINPVNDAPTANPVVLGTNEDTAVGGSVSGDDIDGDTLTYAVVPGTIVGGTVTMNGATGAFTFTPTPNFNGAASFQYVANDGTVDSAPETVTINVAPVNDTSTNIVLSNAAIAENSANGTVVGMLLGNDPDGDALTYTLLNDAGGRFQLVGDTIQVANGLLLDFEQATTHTIRVRVSDGVGPTYERNLTVAVNNVDPETLVGTNLADRLFGGAQNDVIIGLGGNDVIVGNAGDDEMSGGAGNDFFNATINDGNDVIEGGVGIDRLNYIGINSNLTINISAGTASGAEIGNDQFSGVELIVSGNGNDLISGDNLANSITGGSGNDTVDGGIGGDSIFATVNDGNDAYAGGDGVDFYILNATSTGATVNLNAGTATSAQTGSDTLTGIENVTGSTGGDNITGNGDANTLAGDGGDDRLDGSGGNDNLIGGLGNDTLIGGAGNDTMNASQGDDTIVFTLLGGTTDRVVSFDADTAGGQDRLDVSALGITAATFAASVIIVDVGADTLVTAGGNIVRLVGVDGNGANQITIADFLLA